MAHDVKIHDCDRDALAMMGRDAREAMGCDDIEVIVDKGYYKGGEIVDCENKDIAVTVSKPYTSNAPVRGCFDRADFVNDADEDLYICPADQQLIYRMDTLESGKTLHSY